MTILPKKNSAVNADNSKSEISLHSRRRTHRRNNVNTTMPCSVSVCDARRRPNSVMNPLQPPITTETISVVTCMNQLISKASMVSAGCSRTTPLVPWLDSLASTQVASFHSGQQQVSSHSGPHSSLHATNAAISCDSSEYSLDDVSSENTPEGLFRLQAPHGVGWWPCLDLNSSEDRFPFSGGGTQRQNKMPVNTTSSATSTNNGPEISNAAQQSPRYSAVSIHSPRGDCDGFNTSDSNNNNEGNNSEDEYDSGVSGQAPPNEAEEIAFKEKLKRERGFIIKPTGTDGACLFRAVADQVYGDQELHHPVRQQCIEYMAKNSDYFSPFVTEDFQSYLIRKSQPTCHGNHLEIQAMCELYNRPIEVYQYSLQPINTFTSRDIGAPNPPIRLSYHYNSHYNSVIDPLHPAIGVGLGIPGKLQPGKTVNQHFVNAAIQQSEISHIEQTMLADKLRETDWEVTQDAIQDQVARESYLQWLRDNELRTRRTNTVSSTTITSSNKQQKPQIDKRINHKTDANSGFGVTSLSDTKIAAHGISADSDAKISHPDYRHLNSSLDYAHHSSSDTNVSSNHKHYQQKQRVAENSIVPNEDEIKNYSNVVNPNDNNIGKKTTIEKSMTTSENPSTTLNMTLSTTATSSLMLQLPSPTNQQQNFAQSSSRDMSSHELLVAPSSPLRGLSLSRDNGSSPNGQFFDDWIRDDETDVLARVLAQSQQEYLNSLQNKNS